jgi:urease accessory protein
VNSVLQHSGWQAQLDLAFAQRDSRTVLSKKQHIGPLVVQKPFYPEGGLCHVYIIHPPGGVVGGDTLAINVTGHSESKALITTPAANKFYRSGGPVAQLKQTITVEDNACLEWLPQETILFNGCAVHATTRIQLGDNSRFIGWEITCLGRPASSEAFTNGLFRQRFELYQHNNPLFVERALLQGGDPILEAPWGLQSNTVTGTMLAYPADATMLELARNAIPNQTDALASSTLINQVMVCRYLGHHGEQAKNLFTAAWSAIRPACMQREACVPRIWYT